MTPTPVKFPLRATMAGFRRFTVAEYHKLIETGVLTENDRLELLDGYLVEKTPHDPIHDGTIQLVEDAVRRVLPPGWCVRVQSAVTLTESEPEPDVSVVRGDKRSYLGRHPSGADIGLVIEVSNSTLDSDRDDKIPLYARDSLPVYWIVNLIDRQIEVHGQPSSPSYGTRNTYKLGDTVPVVLAGVAVGSIAVADLLRNHTPRAEPWPAGTVPRRGPTGSPGVSSVWPSETRSARPTKG